MSEKSGPITTLQAALTHAIINTYYNVTNTITLGPRANSIRLFVTSSVSSPGDVSFRLTVANPGSTLLGATTYYDYCTDGEAPETFGPLKFSAAGQTKMIILRGLDLLPNDVVRVSYAASANAAGAKVAIVGETFHSDLGSSDISTGDIEVDVAALEVLLTDIPNVIGTDGAAGPTKTVSVGGTKADGTINEVLIGTGVMADSLAVTIATDDTMFTALDTAVDAIDTNTDDIPNVIGTDGAAGPTKTVSVAGTKADGTINEVLIGTGVMADSLAVTLATDDVLSTATGIHDVAAAAKLGGVRLIGNATAAQQVAVADGDDAKVNTNLNGELRIAGHTIATTSIRVENINPLSAQYVETVLIQNEAVALDPGASYAPVGGSLAMAGYGEASFSIYLLGGIGAAATDRTVTLTFEVSNGATVAAALVWPDATESLKSMRTGLDSAASYTSTGAAAYSDVLTLRNEDSNVKLVRFKYDWSGDPSVTNGMIVIVARQRAI